MTRLVGIAAAIVVLGIGGLWFATGQYRAPGLDLASIGAAEAQEVDTSGVLEMSMGNPDAPVTVIEYASFTCPHCRTFHQGAFEDLKADYIDTGKINFIYREVYFDRPGLWAAMVARCGGPDRFFGIADLIYENQSTWAGSGDPVQIAEGLRRIGRTAGLENDQLDACLTDADKAQAMVAAYQQNAEEHNIRSTPSFVINGTTHGNMSYADMSALLDAAGAN